MAVDRGAQVVISSYCTVYMFFILWISPEIAASFTAKVAMVLPRKLRMCLLLAQLFPGSVYHYTHMHKEAACCNNLVKSRGQIDLFWWLQHNGHTRLVSMLNFQQTERHRQSWLSAQCEGVHTRLVSSVSYLTKCKYGHHLPWSRILQQGWPAGLFHVDKTTVQM